MQIEQIKSTHNIYSSLENKRCSQIENFSNEISHSDNLMISSEAEILTSAIDSVRQEIMHSRSIGYIHPPRCLSNEKQIEIIAESIKNHLGATTSDTILNSAKLLWKDMGYRDENSPLPLPFTDSYNTSDFLTIDDRKKLDLKYESELAQGVAPKIAGRNIINTASPIEFERYKKETIKLGTQWFEGTSTLSDIEWQKLVEKNLELEHSSSSSEFINDISTTNNGRDIPEKNIDYLGFTEKVYGLCI